VWGGVLGAVVICGVGGRCAQGAGVSLPPPPVCCSVLQCVAAVCCGVLRLNFSPHDL